jgi:hypothetical protein
MLKYNIIYLTLQFFNVMKVIEQTKDINISCRVVF